jgi:hypothetical protein
LAVPERRGGTLRTWHSMISQAKASKTRERPFERYSNRGGETDVGSKHEVGDGLVTIFVSIISLESKWILKCISIRDNRAGLNKCILLPIFDSGYFGLWFIADSARDLVCSFSVSNT